MKKLKIILIALLVTAASVACFFALNKNMIDAKNHYETHADTLEKLIISDYSTDEAYTNLATECKGYINEYKTALDKKNIVKCPKLNKTLTEKEDDLLRYDKVIVSDVATDLRNLKNTKELFDYEIAEIEDAESKASDLIKSENYNQAYTKYSAVVSRLEKISSSDTIDITQYDFSEFPKVKIYLDPDQLTKVIGDSIDGTNFKIIEKVGDDYKELKIDNFDNNLAQLNGWNIDLLADVSDSMSPYFTDVQNATTSFVQNIDMTQNKVGLMSFSDYINRASGFTNDQNQIIDCINGLEQHNLTCLYDALIDSLYYTNNQSGPKCIVAFTDGMDTKSYGNYQDVCNLAKLFNIPIYIIGIGYNVDSTNLQIICNESNGFYQNIDSLDPDQINQQMTQIYNDILQKQKKLYCITYNDQIEDKSQKRELYIEYNDDKTTVRNQLNDTATNADDSEVPEETKEAQQKAKEASIASFVRNSNIQYFEAINNRDISRVEEFYEPNSKMLKEVQGNIDSAIKKNTKLEFYDYQIGEITKNEDGTYYVEYSQICKKDSDDGVKYTETTSIDTVAEKNGRFYLIDYHDKKGSPKILDSVPENKYFDQSTNQY